MRAHPHTHTYMRSSPPRAAQARVWDKNAATDNEVPIKGGHDQRKSNAQYSPNTLSFRRARARLINRTHFSGKEGRETGRQAGIEPRFSLVFISHTTTTTMPLSPN